MPPEDDIKSQSVRKSLQVSGEVFDLLQTSYNESDKRMSFSQFASYKLGLMFNKEKWVQEMYPELKFVAIDNDVVIIRESNEKNPDRNGLYQVQLKDHTNGAFNRKRFECDQCDPPSDCSHVMMAQAIKLSAKLKS